MLASAPGSRRPAVDTAIHGAFAHGLDVTLLVAGGAGLAAALIIVLAMRTRAVAEAEGSLAYDAT